MTEHASVPLEARPGQPRETPPVGLIPGYELIAWIGSGGMGDVYKARQLSLHRVVAIKIQRPLPPSPLDELEPIGRSEAPTPSALDTDRLAREARLMAEVRHANIVTIFDRGFISGQSYTIMEFIEGTNLRSILPHRRPVGVELVRRVIAELVAALEHLHRAGIVHRDLKPENVLLDGDGRAHLTDFGIAVAIDRIGTLTQTTQILGTPDYMAPEQRIGFEVDARADQYSLAVIVYEMLTGLVPVGSYRSVAKLNPRLDPAIDRPLARALESDPEDRFPTISAFGEALVRVLSEVKPRRHRRLVVASGMVTLIFAVAWLVLGLLSGRGRLERGGGIASKRQGPSTSEPSKGPTPGVPVEKAFEAFDKTTVESMLADLSRAIGREPAEAHLYYRRAQCQQALGAFEKMRDDLDTAVRLAPSVAEFVLLRAVAHASLNEPEKGIADYSRAIELDPNQPRYYLQRAWLHSQVGHHGQALADVDRAIQLAPEDSQAYVFRATFRNKVGRYQDAYDDYVQAFNLKPNDPDLHMQASAFLLDLPEGQPRNDALALKLATRAKELTQGRSWLALATLGRAHAANRSWDLGLQEYRRAYEIAPASQRAQLQRLIQDLEQKAAAETKE
ncbi:protein kinase domain-containing protein [Singulisphaera sp. PoT]|uniref:serine/threonine-protein kinase n=1 Tax=Singulisphaera sp. PoT TaxID=3411797 RepID=UPI003BF609A2